MKFRHIVEWGIIVLVNVGSLAYVVVRYRSAASLVYAISVFVGVHLAVFLAYQMSAERRYTPRKVIICSFLLVLGLLLIASAFEKRFLANLVALSSLEAGAEHYHLWNGDGERQTFDLSLPLERFHRMGDETAHLAAALAIRKTYGNPMQIAKMAEQPSRRGPSYWIARALAGHPPGLAALFAPVSLSPPVARVWAFALFIFAVAAAWWAGTQWGKTSSFGLLTAACFAWVPNINWWHMTSVSSDIPPCIFTFLGFGILGHGLTAQKSLGNREYRTYFVAAGILFGLGTFTTFTGALAGLSAVVLTWLLLPPTERKLCHFLWLMSPTVAAVLLGTIYSRMAIPTGPPLLLHRLSELGAMSADGGSYSNPFFGAVTFVRRWPMDLGIPLSLLFVLVPIWLVIKAWESKVREELMLLTVALAVLVPAATFFWPEIRFAYPGWIGVLLGLGFKQFWEELSVSQRAWLISAVTSFGFSKYVLHALFIAS